MQHFNSHKHLNAVTASKNSNKISDILTNSKDYVVIHAEYHFTCFIVKHNLPLNCKDYVGSLLRKMFLENEIPKSIDVRRQKQVFMHAAVCNFKEKSPFASVRYFLDKFPVLLKTKNVDEEIDTLNWNLQHFK